MTDKVQKIKEWISKTQDGLMDANGNFEHPEHEGAYNILCNLDAYIDSMQKECNITGIKSKHATGKLKECIDNISEEGLEQARKQLEENPQECMYSKDNYTDEDRKALCDGCEEECRFNKKEEPVSEDLGEEIDSYFAKWLQGASDEGCFNPDSQLVSIYDCHRIARHFANWQKKKDESYTKSMYKVGINTGKVLIKEQLMAKAKSGTVQKDNQVILDNGAYIDLDPSMKLKPSFIGLKEGDRIKVIIIKED